MRVAAGVVASDPYPIGFHDAALVQFTISPDRLSETELLDSGSASPGRYCGEVVRRLRRLYPQASLYLALNPQHGFPSAGLKALLDVARGLDPATCACAVLADQGGRRPLAYAVRAAEAAVCPPAHFSLLSALDAALDHRLLELSLGPGPLSPVEITGVSEGANGFAQPINLALLDVTRRAIAVLAKAPSAAARRELLQRRDRVAVVGFHAGDVLFMLQALALEETPFRAIAVPPDYADLCAYLCPDLEVLVARLRVPHRGAYHITDDAAALLDYIDQLEAQGAGMGRFFHLLRPFHRDYNRTRHHLREIAAFAVGGEGHRLRPLPALSPASRTEYSLVRHLPGRVIVQFDAGWPLKGFPQDSRRELLDLLLARGYQPVILGEPELSAPQVPAVRYTDLASFRALLGSAQAMIGCDSFPAHFADLWGVPTVTLFGPTRPHNSRGNESPHYRYLHHPMPCVPCGMMIQCRLDSGNSCHAQARASEVLAALEAMVPPPPVAATGAITTCLEEEESHAPR